MRRHCASRDGNRCARGHRVNTTRNRRPGSSLHIIRACHETCVGRVALTGTAGFERGLHGKVCIRAHRRRCSRCRAKPHTTGRRRCPVRRVLPDRNHSTHWTPPPRNFRRDPRRRRRRRRHCVPGARRTLSGDRMNRKNIRIYTVLFYTSDASAGYTCL